MDPETIMVIIWGLVKRSQWSEAKRVVEVLNLIKMKTELSVRGETIKQQYERIHEKNSISDEELCYSLPMESST